MKGSVIVAGKRIEPGDRVQIVAGPYQGRFGLFRKKASQKGKVIVVPWMANVHLRLDAGAIRRAEVQP